VTVHTDTHILAEYSVLLYLCISLLDGDVLEVETCRRDIRDKVLFIIDLQFVGLRIDHEQVATLISQYSQSAITVSTVSQYSQ
jgi:hypothetical protein